MILYTSNITIEQLLAALYVRREYERRQRQLRSAIEKVKARMAKRRFSTMAQAIAMAAGDASERAPRVHRLGRVLEPLGVLAEDELHQKDRARVRHVPRRLRLRLLGEQRRLGLGALRLDGLLHLLEFRLALGDDASRTS